MIDTFQSVLLAVIVVLSIILSIIGVAVYQILVEIRGSIRRFNKILDDTGKISEAIATPVEEAVDFVRAIKKGVGFLKHLSRFFKEKEEEKKEKEEVLPENKKGFLEITEPKKRFFTQKGKVLGK